MAEVLIPTPAAAAAAAVVVTAPADPLAGDDDAEPTMLRVVVAFAPSAAADPPEVKGEGGRAAISFHGVHPTHISYTITPRDQ